MLYFENTFDDSVLLLLIVVTMCLVGILQGFRILFSWEIILMLWHPPFLLRFDVKLKAPNVHAWWIYEF